jgi:hypothetical protein
MDHLIPVFPQIQPGVAIMMTVPCFTNENFDQQTYSMSTYKDYPKEAGWEPRASRDWQELFLQPTPEFRGFLQRWRYFSLISKCFWRLERNGLHGFPRIKDLTRKDSKHGLIVDTSKLIQYLQLSRLVKEDHALLHDKIKTSWLEALMVENGMLPEHQCSCTASDSDDKYDLYSYIRQKNPPEVLPQPIVDSIHLVLDLLHRQFIATKSPNTTQRQGLIPIISDVSHVTTEMLRRGWCPWKVAALWNRFCSSAMFCIAQLPTPDTHDHRSQCAKDKCNFYQMDMNNYHMAHANGCHGSCAETVADIKDLYGKLSRTPNSFTFPLIENTSSSTSNSKRIRLSQYTSAATIKPGSRYVAISHVWSDGFGNPQRNGMPICQLNSISKKVTTLIGDQIPFWLDTICCPVDDNAPEQITAIALMEVTYAKAEAVLVLDKSLLDVHIKTLENHEILLRIFCSSWMDRLWTFQEGALARKLFFQFADKAFDLQNGIEMLRNSQEPKLSYTLKKPILFQYEQLSVLQDDQLTYPQRVVALAAALRFRSTSVASDEALCLSTMLRLDTKAIASVTGQSECDTQHKRMELFWSSLKEVPSDIAIFNCRKLTSHGLQWAPLSFLRLRDGRHQDAGAINNVFPTVAYPQRCEGLLCKFSGFSLYLRWTRPFADQILIQDKVKDWFVFNADDDDYRHRPVSRPASTNQCRLHGKSLLHPPQGSQVARLWVLHQSAFDWRRLTQTIGDLSITAMLVYGIEKDADGRWKVQVGCTGNLKSLHRLEDAETINVLETALITKAKNTNEFMLSAKTNTPYSQAEFVFDKEWIFY